MTSGQTNHLDLETSSDIVIASVPSNQVLPSVFALVNPLDPERTSTTYHFATQSLSVVASIAVAASH
ncbi:MAG: hypothetical protein WCG98_08475 [bacterium]